MSTIETPFISIVMPVYNNEKYFPLAVQSILTQADSDFELIIIDDGSTDNTSNIADMLAASDARIKVIHQTNQWIYASFNNGIEEAAGEYVYIVNSDDKLRQGALSLLERKVREYNFPDVVWTKVLAHICDEQQNILEYDKGKFDKLVRQQKYLGDRNEVHRNWPYLIKSYLAQNQANLYRRNVIKRHNFRNDVYGADMLFNIDIAEDVNTALILPEPIYDHFIYNKEYMNASIGKYYAYEHEMFNEIYVKYQELFEKWQCPADEYQEILADWRLRSLTTELRSLGSAECPITIDQKLAKVFHEYVDEIVMQCVIETGKIEEFESRMLSGTRELLLQDDILQDESMYFVYELLESLLRFEKDDMDYNKIEHAVGHPLNPAHIGQFFYQKLKNSKR